MAFRVCTFDLVLNFKIDRRYSYSSLRIRLFRDFIEDDYQPGLIEAVIMTSPISKLCCELMTFSDVFCIQQSSCVFCNRNLFQEATHLFVVPACTFRQMYEH